MTDAPPVLIAGPTGSGKSRLAVEVASRCHGAVINTDSMQVYDQFAILSARPDPAESRGVPHLLYGHVSVTQRYSVGLWLRDVADRLAEISRLGRRPIFVGGTGLYFRALIQGLAAVPEVPAAVRTLWRERAATLSALQLHEMLAKQSSNEGRRVRPSDRSRIIRALEVMDATGRTLPEWQDEAAGVALVDPRRAIKVVLTPPRAGLYDEINRRFLKMMEAGALEEARRIALLDLDPDLPAMKLIGLSPLLAHLRGERELEETIAEAQADSRNYAKRQMTWFRNQMTDWPAYVSADDPMLTDRLLAAEPLA